MRLGVGRRQKFIQIRTMSALSRFDIVAAVPTLYIAPSWRIKCQKPDGQADMPEDLDRNARRPAPWPVYSPGSTTSSTPNGTKPFHLFPSTEAAWQPVPEPAPTGAAKKGWFGRIGRWLRSAVSSCWNGVLHAMDVLWGTFLAIDLTIKVTRSINRLCEEDGGDDVDRANDS